MNKEYSRSLIFRHLDGIVTAPTVASLIKKDIVCYILDQDEVTLSKLTEVFKANEGYLNVALRTLASQGFLDYSVDHENDKIIVSKNCFTQYLQKYSPLYLKAVSFQKEYADIKIRLPKIHL